MNAYYLLDPRFISFTPTLHRVYLDAPAKVRTRGVLMQLMHRAGASILRSLRRNATRRALHALDDGLLRDIGIDRTQINAVVESLLNANTAPVNASVETASVHRLVTKQKESATSADSLATAA